jgi:hypothetical protein
MQDLGCSLHSNSEAVALYRELRIAGIVNGDYASVVREVRRKQHKFTAPKFYEFSTESDGVKKVNIGQLRDLLIQIICEAETLSTHILALDGLDSAEIGTDSYWKQLAALIRACTAVHRRVRKARSRLRVCLLCRNDVFLKIPIPDSNKIRQGWGVELEWSYGLETPEDSSLWDLLEKKVSARGVPITNLVDLYFPEFMEVGQRTNPNKIRMPKYLIELTRNTPRDMVMLMKSIQSELLPEQDLDVRRVRAGVNSYCKHYFAGEISNELVGMVSGDVAQVILGSMSRLPGRRFSRDDFIRIVSNISGAQQSTTDEILQQLYMAGAIASIAAARDEDYFRFYHRRSYVELDLRGPFMLHNALTLGLNLPWNSANRT